MDELSETQEQLAAADGALDYVRAAWRLPMA